MQESKDLSMQLQQALAECARLREENAGLRSLLIPNEEQVNVRQEKNSPMSDIIAVEMGGRDFTQEAKVSLFRSLFRGREDLYALRWEGRDGRSGYSPAFVKEWEQKADGSFKLKKTVNREYFPLTEDVTRNHLLGQCTVGIYPLLIDETCWLLAADFDKKTWQDDVRAFLDTCIELSVPASLERSRSGNGGHIWIFFDRPISAALARKLGCLILTRTMERRRQLGLDSYDRFFPNQDTMPKGGFGNLIALPLQRTARSQGNSLFLDENFQAYPDQWKYLSTVSRISAESVEAIVKDASKLGDIIGVRRDLTDEQAEDDPWSLPPSRKRPEKSISGPFPEFVRIIKSNLLYIEKAGLSPALLNRLIRIAAFQNPEFYRAQAMRLSTFGKPRVICCAEEFPHHLALPRGSWSDLAELLHSLDIKVEVIDERYVGEEIKISFNGSLRPLQQMAIAALQPHDEGVLSAPTAFGKTAVAAWLIAERSVNTLILVHRRQLLDQWRERLGVFLDAPLSIIGQIGGGKDSRAGIIDVGMLQSVNHRGMISDLAAEYGQVIVDECHHISAFSFEQVLRQVKAKYVLGLTATPVRKDGHHPIITMQCGPIRYQLSEKKMASTTGLKHSVIPRHTDFVLPENSGKLGIQEIYEALTTDRSRDDLIIEDLLREVNENRSPILLTERKDHLRSLSERLKDMGPTIIELKGGMGIRQRREAMEKLQSISDTEPRVILATGRYIGEGFDDARLDTLFLSLPISWRGTLQQYVGRLHRTHDNKRDVRVYDYVDVRVPMLMRMYEKRLRGYRAIGYTIENSTARAIN